MGGTKGNDGRAARRMLWRRLGVVLSCFGGVLLVLNLLGIGGNAAENGTKSIRKAVRRHSEKQGYAMTMLSFFAMLYRFKYHTASLMSNPTIVILGRRAHN